MRWSFSVSLQHFVLILVDRAVSSDSGTPSSLSGKDFLTATLHGINVSLDLTPKVDHELRDVYQWRFHGGLTNFETAIFGKPFMYFQRQRNIESADEQRQQSANTGETSPSFPRTSFFEAVENEMDLMKESIRNRTSITPTVPEINYVDVTNEIGRTGHTLMIGLELKPLVTKIQPETIRRLVQYFSFETSDTFTEEIDRLREIQRTMGYNERSFLGDIVAEQAEKFRSRVLEEQMVS